MPVQGWTAPVLSCGAQSTACFGTSVRDSPISISGLIAFRRCGVPGASCRGSGAQLVYSQFRPMPRLCFRHGEESSVPLLQQQMKVTLQGDAFARAQSCYAPLNLGDAKVDERTSVVQTETVVHYSGFFNTDSSVLSGTTKELSIACLDVPVLREFVVFHRYRIVRWTRSCTRARAPSSLLRTPG